VNDSDGSLPKDRMRARPFDIVDSADEEDREVRGRKREGW
jgi:hypothetical protein